MRLPFLRRFILFLLVVSFVLLFVRTIFNSFKFKCNRMKSSLRNFPIVIVNHSNVASDPKGNLSVSSLFSPNSSICHSTMVILHSHIVNIEERNRLRRIFKKSSFRLLFVLGIEDDPSPEILRNEMDQFNDLLVTDLIEDYHNITYKAQAWIRFLFDNCKEVRWIVKMDDDVEVNPFLLQSLLLNHQHYSRIIIGRVYMNSRVMRNPKSKWYLSPSEYHSESLGQYLQGMSYVISADLLPMMKENIERVQFLWMDDWYVTHALLNGITASLIDISSIIGSANSREEVDQLKSRRDQLIFMHLRPKEE
ncbi:hypothetical protein PENTCL1PPCAC_26770, partial [Pristionchus entomophagus]